MQPWPHSHPADHSKTMKAVEGSTDSEFAQESRTHSDLLVTALTDKTDHFCILMNTSA